MAHTDMTRRRVRAAENEIGCIPKRYMRSRGGAWVAERRRARAVCNVRARACCPAIWGGGRGLLFDAQPGLGPDHDRGAVDAAEDRDTERVDTGEAADFELLGYFGWCVDLDPGDRFREDHGIELSVHHLIEPIAVDHVHEAAIDSASGNDVGSRGTAVGEADAVESREQVGELHGVARGDLVECHVLADADPLPLREADILIAARELLRLYDDWAQHVCRVHHRDDDVLRLAAGEFDDDGGGFEAD